MATGYFAAWCLAHSRETLREWERRLPLNYSLVACGHTLLILRSMRGVKANWGSSGSA